MSSSSSSNAKSGPLNSADILTLKEILIEAVIIVFFYGTYFILAGLAFYHLGIHVKNIRARTVLLAATSTMFICTSVPAILILAGYGIEYDELGFNPPDLSSWSSSSSVANAVCARTNYILSDCIVAWRAWVLYPMETRVKLILSSCLVATCVCITLDLTFVVLHIVGNSYFGASGPITLVLTLPSLSTNAIATSLVSYKVWCHHREVKGALDSNRRTRVENILALLAESGSIYCIVWLFNMLVALTNSPENSNRVLYIVGSSLLPQFTSLYPIIVILLVVAGQSPIDNLSTFNAMQVSAPGIVHTATEITSMRFARPDAVTASSTGAPTSITVGRTESSHDIKVKAEKADKIVSEEDLLFEKTK